MYDTDGEKKCGICGVVLSLETHTLSIWDFSCGSLSRPYIPHLYTDSFDGEYLCVLCKEVLKDESEKVSKIAKDSMVEFAKTLKETTVTRSLEYYKLRNISITIWTSCQIWTEVGYHEGGVEVLAMPRVEAEVAFPDHLLSREFINMTEIDKDGNEFKYIIMISDVLKSPWYDYENNKSHKKGKPIF